MGYIHKNNPNNQSAIWVYNIEKSEKTQLTDATFSDRSPVFSECGNYIFFRSNRDFNLAFSDFEFNYLYNKATRIYAVALRKDSPRLLDIKETLETPSDDSQKSTEQKKDNAKKDDKSEKDLNVTIDFDGINQRIVAFPLPSGSYWNLDAIKNGIVFVMMKDFNDLTLKSRSKRQ